MKYNKNMNIIRYLTRNTIDSFPDFDSFKIGDEKTNRRL